MSESHSAHKAAGGYGYVGPADPKMDAILQAAVDHHAETVAKEASAPDDAGPPHCEACRQPIEASQEFLDYGGVPVLHRSCLGDPKGGMRVPATVLADLKRVFPDRFLALPPARRKTLRVDARLFLMMCADGRPYGVELIANALPDDYKIVDIAAERHPSHTLVFTIESQTYPEVAGPPYPEVDPPTFRAIPDGLRVKTVEILRRDLADCQHV